MESSLAAFLTNPLVVLAASVLIFFSLAWAVLPFALYGVRRRLDRVIETLGRMEAALARSAAPRESGGTAAVNAGERNGDFRAARQLMVDLRRELLQFSPAMQERALDPDNIVVFCRSEEGFDIPCLVLTLKERGVDVSVPLKALKEAFSAFSPELFRDYAISFLPEKYGYYPAASPDGRELHVHIEPRDSNSLELFVGIIREQMYDSIKGGAP